MSRNLFFAIFGIRDGFLGGRLFAGGCRVSLMGGRGRWSCRGILTLLVFDVLGGVGMLWRELFEGVGDIVDDLVFDL